jgi:L-amino acid N-acyltransferase YncA
MKRVSSRAVSSGSGAVAAGPMLAKTLTLSDGRVVALRAMGLPDRDKIIAFARALPQDDLLFLRTDITESSNIDDWMRHIKEGATVTMLAEIDEKLAGYASVHTDQARWTRTIGEIRMQVGRQFRGLGLGRVLASEIFAIGKERGLRKMAAMMTPDQAGARAAFEKLGFQIEALLQSWVVDRNGRPRDLIIMSQMLDGAVNNAAA